MVEIVRGYGLGEIEALDIVGSAGGGELQLFFGLNTLLDDGGTLDFDKRSETLQGLVAVTLFMKIPQDGFVDFDVFEFATDDAHEVGIAGAEVIEG